TFYCGGGFDLKDPNETGARIENHGIVHDGAFRFGVRMTPPAKGRGLVEAAYRVPLPAEAGLRFRAHLRVENLTPSGEAGTATWRCRVEVVEDLEQPAGQGRVVWRG